MTDSHGNIRFNPALHDYSYLLFSEALADVEGIMTMVGKLYPNADHGAADKVRRNLASAASALRNVQYAMGALSVEETASGGPWLTDEATRVADRPVEQCLCTVLYTADEKTQIEKNDECPVHSGPHVIDNILVYRNEGWPFPRRFTVPLRCRVEVLVRDVDGVVHYPPYSETEDGNGLVQSVNVLLRPPVTEWPMPLWFALRVKP